MLTTKEGFRKASKLKSPSPTGAIQAPVSPPAVGLVFWKQLQDGVIHTIIGTTIFITMAISAILLSHGVEWVEANPSLRVSPFVMTGLTTGEELLFAADFLLYASFLARLVWKAFVNQWS